MIEFDFYRLANGLRVIHHYDPHTPLAVVNILYNVGARDEDPELTGMAHLFEHLMFGGSKNAPVYDEPVQLASGENNAFTSNDITNYYLTLPAENIETALWLESDRMFQLTLTQKALEVQQGVVIEEFKQRYLNQPYGDLWLKFRPLVYHQHPYRWATIGKEISHIEKVKLSDLQAFYERFYHPSNAILVVAGNISAGRSRELVDKWFASIPSGEINKNQYPAEPPQTEGRELRVEADVPLTSLSFGFHCGRRSDPEYHSLDLLSSILSGSESSRLQQKLVKEQQLFTDIHAFSTESLDEGLFVISGRIYPGLDEGKVQDAVWAILDELCSEPIPRQEWQKVLNKKLTALKYSELEVLNKAMNLAMFANLGDPGLVNSEEGAYRNTSPDSILEAAKSLFKRENCSTLLYAAKP